MGFGLMKDCKLVEDLWPLYIDKELSDESTKFIEDHLEGCNTCKDLKKSQPEYSFDILVDQQSAFSPINSASTEKFISKLKRKIRFGLSAFILTLLLVFLGIWYYADWSAQKEYLRKQKEEQAFFKEQLSALQQVSPPTEDILKKYGVTFSIPQASANARQVTVKYVLDWDATSPVEWVSTENEHWFDDNMLVNAETGNPLNLKESGTSSGRDGLKAHIQAEIDEDKPNKLLLKTETLYLFLKATTTLDFKYKYSGNPKVVKIDQKYSFKDVDFLIEELVLGKENFIVKYRQLTPASEVGVYQLTFSFDDRLGNTWNSDPEANLAVKNPKEFIFPSIPSPSKSWILRVGHVVQVVSAIETEINLKGEK